MNIAGSKKPSAKPPLKGIFPLDHEGECKDFMARYMKCLEENDQKTSMCRDLSREYLQCRVEHELMEEVDFKEYGFKNDKGQANNKS